jgi:hypothetical protein
LASDISNKSEEGDLYLWLLGWGERKFADISRIFYLRKATARQVVAQVNQVGRQNAWPSSYLYPIGLPEKSAGAAGSGSDAPRLTTEKSRGLLLIFILWSYLRKAPARQVMAQMSYV